MCFPSRNLLNSLRVRVVFLFFRSLYLSVSRCLYPSPSFDRLCACVYVFFVVVVVIVVVHAELVTTFFHFDDQRFCLGCRQCVSITHSQCMDAYLSVCLQILKGRWLTISMRILCVRTIESAFRCVLCMLFSRNAFERCHLLVQYLPFTFI